MTANTVLRCAIGLVLLTLAAWWYERSEMERVMKLYDSIQAMQRREDSDD